MKKTILIIIILILIISSYIVYSNISNNPIKSIKDTFNVEIQIIEEKSDGITRTVTYKYKDLTKTINFDEAELRNQELMDKWLEYHNDIDIIDWYAYKWIRSIETKEIDLPNDDLFIELTNRWMEEAR